jgi:cellulose synthase/poly-beta-1,6-N-acetylglucosamine synthase-like glycosyltransferase
MLSILTISALIIFSSTYILYYAHVSHQAKKPWNLKTDENYQPFISILIPVHNEEKNIEKKLENIQAVDYPKEKIELIIADDASEDKTLIKIDEAVKTNSGLRVKIIKQKIRGGKAIALNEALKAVSSPIVIVSDADTFWPSNVLKNAMPYLADPSVGAITGQGVNKQINESWVTKSEDNYLQITSSIRLGESKIHSTIRFEGGFCAFKREAFKKFDCESGADDSGTALDVVRHNYRAILVPSVIFYTSFPVSLKGKLRIKVRRANQLIGLWAKCLTLIFKKQLTLPKRIVVPEVFLFAINPLVFLLLVASALFTIFLAPFSILSIFLIASTLMLLIFARNLFFELIIDNLILFYASISYLFGRRYVAWKKTN